MCVCERERERERERGRGQRSKCWRHREKERRIKEERTHTYSIGRHWAIEKEVEIGQASVRESTKSKTEENERDDER